MQHLLPTVRTIVVRSARRQQQLVCAVIFVASTLATLAVMAVQP